MVLFRQVSSAMESSSNPSSCGKIGVVEVAKLDETAKTGKLSRGMTAITFVVGAILGAALGAGVASHVLESEFSEFRKHRFPRHSSLFMYADKSLNFQLVFFFANGYNCNSENIVTKLQSDLSFATLKTRDNYNICQTNLSGEKRSREEEVARLRIHANQNERAYQRSLQQYLEETNAAYNITNEALQKASSRLKREIENYESAQLRLSQVDGVLLTARSAVAKSMKELEESNDERDRVKAQLQLLRSEFDMTKKELERGEVEKAECNDQLQYLHSELEAIIFQLDTTEKELDRRDVERVECKDQLQYLRSELDETEEELDRRDVERAECDALNQDLLALKKKSTHITEIIEEKNQLARQLQLMTEKDEFYAAIDIKLNESERQRVYWEAKATNMIDNIKFRNRNEVLEEFGPGPFFVKLTFAFQDSLENESILIELAPLDLMPHTVHMFLKMTSEKLYSKATFVLVRSHILVLGPEDSFDAENNAILKERMVSEGYEPNGALLFGEFTPEYPHTQYTVAFNRRRGPTFFINMRDNSGVHRSYYTDDGSYVEGETCFAKIVEGLDVLPRILRLKKKDGETLESAVYIVDSQVVNVTE